MEAIMEAEKETRTIYDCIKADHSCLVTIKDAMDLLIGHELYDVYADGLFYRGHYFKVVCLGKQEKGTGKILKKG